MPLPDLLIEYLVAGSFSALWILLLLATYHPEIFALDSKLILAVLVPLSYILGMISDFVGDWWVDQRKDDIQREVRREKDASGKTVDVSGTTRIKIDIRFPEVAKQLQMRSSRDRIARGVLVNVPLLGMATLVWRWQKSELKDYGYFGPLATVLLLEALLEFAYQVHRRRSRPAGDVKTISPRIKTRWFMMELRWRRTRSKLYLALICAAVLASGVRSYLYWCRPGIEMQMIVIIVVTWALFLTANNMWERFQKHSTKYERNAARLVD